MMTFAYQITQTLNAEHTSTVALMQQLEQLAGKYGRDKAPDATDAAVRKLLNELVTWASTEIDRHFSFEEDRLFPLLAEGGNAEIGEHLTEEHKILRKLGTAICEQSREAMASGFDLPRWRAFRQTAQDLCGPMSAHAQKEDMALLPLLDESIDPTMEAQLYQDYVGNT